MFTKQIEMLLVNKNTVSFGMHSPFLIFNKFLSKFAFLYLI